MKFTELFTLLNSRLLNQNNKVTKTIISTNLDLNELSSRYGERIISRFIGNYNICYFFGDDIRIKNRSWFLQLLFLFILIINYNLFLLNELIIYSI